MLLIYYAGYASKHIKIILPDQYTKDEIKVPTFYKNNEFSAEAFNRKIENNYL